MPHILEKIGPVPVTTAVLSSFYPEVSNLNMKISSLEKNGELIRLKRGLYVVAPDVSRTSLSSELIANHIYGPSYVSQMTALRYYGLIPERVFIMQSMSIKHSKKFSNAFGVFVYSKIERETFGIGVRSERFGKYSFLIASPEKALCDVIAQTGNLQLRSRTDVIQFLEEDLRLDMDAFAQMNPQIFEDYADAGGKKSSSIRMILNVLKNE